MAVADIGAGTGLFTRLIASEVGPSGKGLRGRRVQGLPRSHRRHRPDAAGQAQVATVRGTQDSTNLPPDSVDLVFLCDVYHHLENHEKILASIRRALRVKGVLVLVEFDRVEGKSSQFVLKHIRAGQEEFRREIEAAGFEPDPKFHAPRLKENFVARFRKSERTDRQTLPRSRDEAGAGIATRLMRPAIGAYRLSARPADSDVSTPGRRRRPDLVPDLDESRGLGVSPGETSLFEIIGATAPVLTPFHGPVRHHAAISQRMEHRGRRPRARGAVAAGAERSSLDGENRNSWPAARACPARHRPHPRPRTRWRAFLGHSERATRLGFASGSEAHARENPPDVCVLNGVPLTFRRYSFFIILRYDPRFPDVH